MTRIRTRLLTWLLPPLIAFIALISTFFYFNWYDEIEKSFKRDLEGIVVSVSKLVDVEEVKWIKENRNEATVNSPVYKELSQKLTDIKNQLPIASLYIVSIEEVKQGETVFPNKEESATNPVYTGENPSFAYRQVYLIDASGKAPFPVDFSESNEVTVYQNKKVLITPIYKGLSTSENFMSGYAPLIDKQGEVVALVGADINLKLYSHNLHRALSLIALGGLLTVLLVTLSSIFIATKITKPVQQLKDAALVLASGEYDEKIDVKGPKEIVELASTINTLRECLIDNMSRLTNYTAVQSKLYGEYECGEILQEHMLQKSAANLKSPYFKVKALELDSSDPTGVNLILKDENGLNIKLDEATEPGFQAIFDLLSHPSSEKTVSIKITNDGTIDHKGSGLPDPLLWSTKLSRFIPFSEGMKPGDFLILYNTGLQKQMPSLSGLRDWFQKVLRHFSKEGPELTSAMFESELNFLSKKHLNHEDLKIVIVYKSPV